MNVHQSPTWTLDELLKLEVHPLAARAPMLPEDELQALADDIAANGLKHPIIIWLTDGKWLVIDGRNRLAACQLIGLEPSVEIYTGENVAPLIVSENITRRNLKQSQRVMWLALCYPKKNPGKKTSTSLATKEVNAGTLSFARALVNAKDDTADLIDQVMAGDLSVDAAHRQWQIRTGQQNQLRERLAKLEKRRPDLREKVPDELTIDQAESKADTDERELEQARYAATAMLIEGVKQFDKPIEHVEKVFQMIDFEQVRKSGHDVDSARLRHIANWANALADLCDKKGEEQ